MHTHDPDLYSAGHELRQSKIYIRELESILDTNGDGVVSEKEIDDALQILKKAKKQKNNDKESMEDLTRENFV